MPLLMLQQINPLKSALILPHRTKQSALSNAIGSQGVVKHMHQVALKREHLLMPKQKGISLAVTACVTKQAAII